MDGGGGGGGAINIINYNGYSTQMQLPVPPVTPPLGNGLAHKGPLAQHTQGPLAQHTPLAQQGPLALLSPRMALLPTVVPPTLR